MTNHPGRSPGLSLRPTVVRALSPTQLVDLRTRFGLTQDECAWHARTTLRNWQRWELGKDGGGRDIPRSSSELLLVSLLAHGLLPAKLWAEPFVEPPLLAAVKVRPTPAPMLMRLAKPVPEASATE